MLIAIFPRILVQPRTRASARPETDFESPVETLGRPALATDGKIAQVAGYALFVEPELPPAAGLAAVGEAAPIEVVHMAPRTGSHETRRHDLSAVEAAPLIERLAVRQAPRATALGGVPVFLYDEPVREEFRADSAAAYARIARSGGRREELGRANLGQGRELFRQARLGDLRQILRLGPGVQSADDGGMPRQVDERARAVGRDYLAASDLALRFPFHWLSSPSILRFRKM